MLRLDSTLRKLQIVLAGAITTNQLPVVVCFSDKTSTTYNGGATVSNTNSTTAVDICAAPGAATIRDIDSITVQNADTAAATVTIRYNDNGTTYSLFKCTLSVGDQIIYTHGQGWKVLDSAGNVKSNSIPSITHPITQEFRLTLTSGTPVTTSDVTGATTIYCIPYVGNRISLYDGTTWNIRSSAQFSLALGTLTSGKPYDVFCYDNSGIPTLEFLAWTNDTTRATALAYQDGVLVKSGAATRRYLGTFYTTSTTQTEDSKTKRYLWNYYNRVSRLIEVADSAVSWTYTTATWRYANGNSANQIEFVIGVNEDVVQAMVKGFASNTTTGVTLGTGIGVDSTTPTNTSFGVVTSKVANVSDTIIGSFCANLSAGKHFLAWLEYSTASGTTTFNGTGAGADVGIRGSVIA